jgi:iron complex outermembrane receptor protein
MTIFATMLHRYIYILLLFVFADLYAQTNEPCHLHIEGDILDKDNQQAIEYATIYIKELNKAINTDENGFFQLNDICAGFYTLYISHLDCETDTVKLNLYKNEHIDLFIKHKNHELDAIEIKEKRKEDKLINSNNTITQQSIDKNGGNNLGALLKEIPGVNTLNTGVGISKPIITGMHSIRVVTINDGVRQEGQQWGTEHAPEIDINTAGEIQVEKGASALIYSHDAVGGLIIIKPKTLRNAPRLNGAIATNISTVNWRGGLNMMLEGQFKKTPNWSWRIQSNNIRAGNTRTPNYYLKNTGFNENDFSFFTSYFRNKWKLNLSYKFYNLRLGIFAGSHIGNLSDLLIAYNASEPLDKDGFRYKINTPRQNIEHHTANLDFTFVLDENNKMNIRYGFQFNKRQEFDKILGRSTKKPAAEFYLYTHSADIDWSAKNKKANYKSILGLNGMYQNNFYGGTYFIPEYNMKNIGIYSFHKYTKNKWTLQGALRGDISFLQISKTKKSDTIKNYTWKGIASNIAVGYQIDYHTNISVSLGSTWRAPHPVELYSDGVHHGTASVEIGNVNLKQERVYFSSLDFSYDEGTRHKVSITLYNKYIANYIYLFAREKPVLTIRGAFPAFEYRQTNANFTGADIYYKIDLSKGFDFSQKLSFVYAYNIIDKNYLPFIPPFNTESKLSYIIPIHKKIDDFKISFIGTYVSRQNLTNRTQEVVANPKGYFLLGFESGLAIHRKKQQEPITLYFEIQNMLNTRYRDYMNRWRYFADEAGINFSIKLKIPFNINQKTN